MRSRSPLALMEQLVMVLVFTLAAAVCVRAFVMAEQKSAYHAARDQAVIHAESMAEVWKSCGGDSRAAAALYGGFLEQGLWVVLYDENWEPLATRDWEAAAFQSALLVTGTEIPGLLAAGIDVHDASNPEPIYTLSVACQTEVTQ